MAEVTRVNGSGLSTAGNVFSNGHIFAYKILVKIANGTAVDLRAEDDAIDEVVEAICREICPLIYHTTDDASGTITVVCDTYDHLGLQHRIRLIGGDWTRSTNTYAVTAVGPNEIDVSGTLVTASATLVAT